MNYKIITDEKKLLEFIEWLPDLKQNEQYYCCLLARSKYCTTLSHIKSDKQQVKRFTSTKERLYEKIKQLECREGSYRQKGNEIPQEALALYIHPNPRNLERAAINSTKLLVDLISSPYTGYNPHQIVMSEIQKSKGTKHYANFDFDNVEPGELKERLEKAINPDGLHFLKTRGGFHLLVDLKKVSKDNKKTWYNQVLLANPEENDADDMIPIPGTYQGGFTPYFL